MHRLLAIALLLTGCGRLFDLEPPVLSTGNDASTGDTAGEDSRQTDGAVDAVPPAQVCPSTYIQLSNSTTMYRFVNANENWLAAQTDCITDKVASSSRYTHLAVVTNDAERLAIEIAINGDTWLGLSDRVVEGAYKWVTNEPTTYPPASGGPWATGEPKVGINENCVTESANAELKVNSCGNLRDYICECDAFPPAPANY